MSYVAGPSLRPTMTTLLWTLSALSLGTVGVVLALYAVHLRRRTVRDRLRAAGWAGFAETCPEPPPGQDSPAYPLDATPGPAGELVVRPDGLCLRLATHAGRTLWVPWGDVRRLEPTVHGGVRLLLMSGLALYLPALAGRAIWQAQAESLRVDRPGPARTGVPRLA